MDINEDCGIVSFDGKNLKYTSSFYGDWQFCISDLVLFGEYTNQDGPHISDHFIIFLCEKLVVYECPIDAGGTSQFLKDLETHFGICLEIKLYGKTDFSSRIAWPIEIQDEPIFEYKEKKSRSFWGRFFGCFGCGEIESSFTKEVTKIQKNGI